MSPTISAVFGSLKWIVTGNCISRFKNSVSPFNVTLILYQGPLGNPLRSKVLLQSPLPSVPSHGEGRITAPVASSISILHHLRLFPAVPLTNRSGDVILVLVGSKIFIDHAHTVSS